MRGFEVFGLRATGSFDRQFWRIALGFLGLIFEGILSGFLW
jgi:hypothetical protein